MAEARDPRDDEILNDQPPSNTSYEQFRADMKNRAGASDQDILAAWNGLRYGKPGSKVELLPGEHQLDPKDAELLNGPDPSDAALLEGPARVTGRNPKRDVALGEPESVIKNPPSNADYAWSYSKSIGRGVYAPIKNLLVDPAKAVGSYGYNLARGVISGPTPQERATAEAAALVDPMAPAADYYNPMREQVFAKHGGKIGPYTEAAWGKLSPQQKLDAILSHAPELAPYVPGSISGKALVSNLILGERPSEKIAAGTPVTEALSQSLQEDPGGTVGNVLTNLWAMNPVRMGALAGLYRGSRAGLEAAGQLPKGGLIPGMKTVERAVPKQADLMEQLAMPWGKEEFTKPLITNRPKISTALIEPDAVAPITSAQDKLADMKKAADQAKAVGDAAEVMRLKDEIKTAGKQIEDMKTALGPQWKNWEAYQEYWDTTGRKVFERLLPNSAERELSKYREAGMTAFLRHFPETTTPELAELARTEKLFKVLQEQNIWDKARAQRGMDAMLAVKPDSPMSQLELKLTQAPEIQAARVGKEQLWVTYAREHPNPGRTETITVPMPLTTAERILASGINQYRIGPELVAAARSAMSNLSLARHDAIRQGKALLQGEETWGKGFWNYFTDPKVREAGAEFGPHAADPYYQKILANSKELVRRGLIDESPSFYQNYLTQSHMNLFEVPGWKPEPAVVDRFVENLRASSSASGKPITVGEARRVAQDIIEQRRPVRLYFRGANVTLPSGPQAGSLIARKELPQWVLDMYGPLKPGPQAYAYTVMEQSKTLIRDSFYRHLENMTVPTTAGPAKVVSDVRLPGFTQIPDGAGFGRLAGKYVADEMVTPLYIIAGDSQRAMTSRLLDIAKRVWIPANVPTWIRNMEGNLFFSILNDGLPNPTKVSELQAWGQAARDASYYIRTGDMPERVKQVAAAGGITGFQIGEYGDIVNFFHRGVGDLLSSPTPRFDDVVAAHLPYVPAEAMKKVAHGTSRSWNTVERIYAAQDLFTRLGNIYTHMARGKSLDEAILGVTKWHPGYDMPSPALALQRGQALPRGAGVAIPAPLAHAGAILSTPVPSFTHESIRIWEHAIREKPFTAATLIMLPFIHNVAMMALQGEQNPIGAYYDLNRQLPDVMKERSYILWPTKKGLHIIDMDPIIPGANLVSSPLQTLGNSPFVTMANEMISNRDSITGRDIVAPGQDPIDAWGERLGQRYTLPPFIVSSTKRAELAQETGLGRKFGVTYEESPLAAIVKEALGISAIPAENAVAAAARSDKGKVSEAKRDIKSKNPKLPVERQERAKYLQNFLEGRE